MCCCPTRRGTERLDHDIQWQATASAVARQPPFRRPGRCVVGEPVVAANEFVTTKSDRSVTLYALGVWVVAVLS